MDGRTKLYNLMMGNTSNDTYYSLPYNTFGRTAGMQAANDPETPDDNFFVKKAKSIENALGTTGAAVKEAGDLGSFIGAIGAGLTGDGHYDSGTSLAQNSKLDALLRGGETGRQDAYKEAGYNNIDDYYNAKQAAERDAFSKIGFDIDSYWDKRADADIAGNKDEVARLDNEYNAAKAQIGTDENLAKFDTTQNRLQDINAQNAADVEQAKKDYNDYVYNNYVGQKINQDRGKFLGSSMNTLSTMLDIMAPGAGAAVNAGQGAWEGFADELEQNGLENFDLGRAAQNAAIGATAGGVTGKFNQALGSKLAKNGGNLFKGNNAITGALNDLGSKTAAGRIGSTIATGAARGAASGAVGGAVGGGMSAAMNGGDIIGSAVQGAQRGATQGALAGGVMAGTGMAYNQAKDAFANSALGQKIDNMTMDDILNGSKKGFVRLPGGEDVETMQINNPYETETPEVKAYTQEDVAIQRGNNPEIEVARRTTTADEPFMAYGESELANKTRRGMLADSLERFGNSLEGAQTNVTRAARKDIGVKNTGEVIENVRKKTGLTNMETQAQFAKEITGGENSLMDRVQKNSLANGEDGKPFLADTSNVANEIESIVNKYADTNMFGSEKAKRAFIDNLRKDIGNRDTDIMTISNRMKANAAELRGKGVGEVPAKDRAQAKIYTEVANKLDDLSYKAIPQENVDNMFNATIEEMRARATQASNNGNKDIARAWDTAANKLDAEPRTVAAFRKFKKDFVDVSKIDDLSAMAENGAAFQMGRGFGGGLKKFTSVFAQRPVNALLAKAGGAVNSIADRIAAGDVETPRTPITTGRVIDGDTPVVPLALPSGEASTPNTRIYDVIGRTQGLTNAQQARTADYLVDATQSANQGGNTLESLIQPSQEATNTGVYSTMYGGVDGSSMPDKGASTLPYANGLSYYPQTGDYWTDIIGIAMSNAINDGDYTTFGALYEMYRDQVADLEKKQSSSSTSNQKLTATQQRANAAMNSLNRISQMKPDLGYNLSGVPIIGNIATMGGNDYEGEAKSLAQQIGYMVSGANIKEEEAFNIGKAYVPQPFDSEQTRKLKLQRAYDIIKQYQAGTIDESA